MNFDKLIEFLEKRLKEPTPGAIAHNRMKPKFPNGAPVQIKHPKPPKEGAVLILLNNQQGKAHFPLIQRPTYEGVHSGQIALPGGKMESTDVSLLDTALRETEEEIGIRKSDVQIIGTLSSFYVAASNYNVLPVIGKFESEPRFIPDKREVDEVINPRVIDLIDKPKKKEKELIVRGGVRLISPYFHLEKKIVWGATAMMLSEFEAILSDFRRE